MEIGLESYDHREYVCSDQFLRAIFSCMYFYVCSQISSSIVNLFLEVPFRHQVSDGTRDKYSNFIGYVSRNFYNDSQSQKIIN